MSRVTPRSENGKHKRDRILDAAASLFAGRELARVTMEDVAACARVAKGTLYNHFDSKENLYFSIITARMTALLEALRNLFEAEEAASVRLRKIVVHSLMFLLKYPDFFRIMRKEGSCPAAGAPRELEESRRDLRLLLREVLEQGMREGTFRQMAPEFAADLVLGCIEGAALRCIEQGGLPARGRPEPEVLFDFVNHALGAAEARRVGGLAGMRILVTREEEADGPLARAVRELGGEPIVQPFVRTSPPKDLKPLLKAAREVAGYDWVVFTSARGAEMFAAARDADAPIPAGTRLAAVGPATARRVRELFGRVDLAAEESTGAGLAKTLAANGDLRGKQILLPRAEGAGRDLPKALRAAGARVDDRIAYRTVPDVTGAPAARERIRTGCVDVVTFASGSAVRAFASRIPLDELRRGDHPVRIVSIGPTTSAALRAAGAAPDAEASEPSMDALALACVPPVSWPRNQLPSIGAVR
jgi:uroporphyrinogen-III synthase